MKTKVVKGHAHIENWSVIHSGGKKYLLGSIRNHPNQTSFHSPLQQTSSLVYLDRVARLAETENTHYTLGEPHKNPSYVRA